jgi:leucyl aminopeptidase
MQAGFLQDSQFTAAAQALVLFPGPQGVAGAVLGLGEDRAPFAFGNLAFRLPTGLPWRLELPTLDLDDAVLGFCLGAYRYGGETKASPREPARLTVRSGLGRAPAEAAASWLVRDLINTPANLRGPMDLAQCAVMLAERHHARVMAYAGEVLEARYPTVAAVGRGSARPAQVVTFHWAGSGASDTAPLLSLCGKGVCFDTGGYDLKPAAGMLRMKKDMGGAAIVLGLARLIMEFDLPIRLAVRVGCVENAVSGNAMRPLDIVRTRSGLTVEIGNTDVEGRLVLCDLLDEACEESPALLIDCATLTGAARVALGPDLPALFCNDDQWAGRLLRSGDIRHDPMWRLPLWPGYDAWLNSSMADLNNVSGKPFAGAMAAALFLQRFIKPGVSWAHLDVYAWNDQARPGRPEGGEAQTMRAIFGAVRSWILEGKKTGSDAIL